MPEVLRQFPRHPRREDLPSARPQASPNGDPAARLPRLRFTCSARLEQPDAGAPTSPDPRRWPWRCPMKMLRRSHRGHLRPRRNAPPPDKTAARQVAMASDPCCRSPRRAGSGPEWSSPAMPRPDPALPTSFAFPHRQPAAPPHLHHASPATTAEPLFSEFQSSVSDTVRII